MYEIEFLQNEWNAFNIEVFLIFSISFLVDVQKKILSIILTRSKQEAHWSLTRVLYDQTHRDCFDMKGKKLKNLGFLGEIFQT